MAKQKMVQEDSASEMVPQDVAPAVKAGKKSKVNMTLPNGSVLTVGEVAVLNAEDAALLELHHGKQMHHILE